MHTVIDHIWGLSARDSNISTVNRTPLKKGDTWYLVDSRWFNKWKKYVGYDSWVMRGMGEQESYPGPIDNSGLIKESGLLKEHLIDELDYICIPTQAWRKLVAWYGIVEDQHTVARDVIEDGMFVKHCRIEVYRMELHLSMHMMKGHVVKDFSKADTVGMVQDKMRRIFNIGKDKETRVWNKYMNNAYELLSKKDDTIKQANLYHGQQLIIEERNKDGTWPRANKNQ
uniref:Ubiquitin carboxyl-terminal hydrolase 15-like n=1 Tax=Saccoglossus kowalevskii TaxID=10224 RepID=A0ABM0M899_SACKO|nr:PREDICTED: ubiquitin carboxyl-terminal hydrolase 15-like [Saccoglossus kowalevskii]